MPQSACLSGSVVHAVARHPDNVAVLLEDFDNVVLIFGNTWQSRRRCRWTPPIALTVDLSIGNTVASRMLVPMPNWRDILGDGQLVAGDHFDFHAHLHRWRWSPWLLARGSDMGNTPTNCHCRPDRRGPRPASGSACGKIVDRLSTSAFTSAMLWPSAG